MDVHIWKIDEAKSGDAIGFPGHLAACATRTVAGFVSAECTDIRIIEGKCFSAPFMAIFIFTQSIKLK